MNQKQILINQPAGLGDICFLQKAVDIFSKAGHECIWPILPQLMWIKDYLISDAQFVNSNDQIKPSPPLVVDFSIADRVFPNDSILEAKYKLINEDFSDWSKYFKFNRNHHKEDELFNLLGLNGKRYSLVSKNYGTQPNYLQKEIYLPEGDIVELQFIEGFTLFDWCKVIENAEEISVVDSSINYVIEVIPTTDKLYLTSRLSPPNFRHIENIFKKNWKKIL